MITVVSKAHALTKTEAQDYKAFCYEAGLSDGSSKERLEYTYLIWLNLPDMTRQYILDRRVTQSNLKGGAESDVLGQSGVG